jgi:hypothetical protein
MLASERHADHVEGYHYERHRPEETVLHRQGVALTPDAIREGLARAGLSA